MRPEFRVYRNLHKDCFSVQRWNSDKKGYRLHSHVKELVAHDVEFRVSRAGRKKVLDTKQKNVHAFVCCSEFTILAPNQELGREVYYNPYVSDSFMIRESMEPITGTSKLIMKNNKCYLEQ